MKQTSLELFFNSQFEEHILVANRSHEQLYKPFSKAVSVCVNSLKRNKKIIIFGNGGSAADAQHIATELTVRFSKNRKALAAIAITTDTSTLTAIGNDFGFEYLFARQIQALGNKGDLLVSISTSGNSRNIINAINTANILGINTLSLLGGFGGEAKKISKKSILVPSKSTARIQEMHILIIHIICEMIEDLRL